MAHVSAYVSTRQRQTASALARTARPKQTDDHEQGDARSEGAPQRHVARTRGGRRELRDGQCPGLDIGPVYVPRTALAGLDVVASSPGGGYNPYQVPSRPNDAVALGVMTILRMYPVDPDDFARRVPKFVTANGNDLDKRVIDWPFGRAIYAESELRDELITSIQLHTNGRLGHPVDETLRARYRGSQF